MTYYFEDKNLIIPEVLNATLYLSLIYIYSVFVLDCVIDEAGVHVKQALSN